jgi:hypothetical protein
LVKAADFDEVEALIVYVSIAATTIDTNDRFRRFQGLAAAD